jgi:hypothetical protein
MPRPTPGQEGHLTMLHRTTFFALLFASAVSFVSTTGAAAPATPQQQPLAAEKNPPGDIPDNQAFVTYRSPLGFSIKTPEGWARHEQPGTVSFNDKYNEVRVDVAPRPAAPTLTSLKQDEVAALERSPNAVRVASAKAVTLPAGPVFVVYYAANSASNPVTNKAIRQDNVRYYFWKGGKLATLTMSAPAGADNADQWLLMARSFAWQ